MTPLPLHAAPADYAAQAASLLARWQAREEEAAQFFRRHHPRLLDEKIPWLPREMDEDEWRTQVFDLADAQLALARGYDFADWNALAAFAGAIERREPGVYFFECAADAVVAGDRAALEGLLRERPGLAQERSTRVTHFDPPVHAATLLHYVAANGVEGYRQKSPANSVAIARLLLEAGADANALASLYGGECTTLSLLVSSAHPAAAGVQVPLVDLLVDFGAAVSERGRGHWVSPLETALVFGYSDAARALVRRGAPVATAASAAGLGDLERLRVLWPAAAEGDRHRALALAAQVGQTAAVAFALDQGEDPNRFNPPGAHAHATPLHHAALGGHLDTVRLLVARGARVDLRDTTYQSTPLGWAEHGGHADVVAFLTKGKR